MSKNQVNLVCVTTSNISVLSSVNVKVPLTVLANSSVQTSLHQDVTQQIDTILFKHLLNKVPTSVVMSELQ